MISLLQSLLLPRFLFFVHFFLFYPPLFSFFSLPLLPAPLLRLLFYLLRLAFSLSPPLPSPSRCPLSPFPPSSLINFLPLSPSLPSSRDMALPEPPSGRGPKEDSSVPSCQEMDVRRSGQVKGVPRREKCGE